MRRMIPPNTITIQRSDQQTERHQRRIMVGFLIQVLYQANIELRSNPNQESSLKIIKALILPKLG